MPDFDQVREIKARVQARLFGFRGVHAVGVGNKIVNGQPTSDLAVMVFVEKKKALSELHPDEVIPTEIEGVKTDVYESERPRNYDDDHHYDQLVGGIRIQPGGGSAFDGTFIGGFGTLGFIARSQDPVPKIFAVTCYHVVGSAVRAVPTTLKVTPTGTTFTFTGANTPGTLVEANLTVTEPGATKDKGYDVFYVTTTSDTFATIASNVSGLINTLAIPGIHAGVDAAGTAVTLQADPGFQLVSFAHGYSQHLANTSASLQASVRGNRILMAGVGLDTGGAYVTVNVGGAGPTFGVFTTLAKGDHPPANATAVATAVQSLHIPNITVDPSGSQVTITGAEEIDCDVNTDIRVGQPSACFCSVCSACCDRRIGVVFAAHLDLDAALIQLDPGVKYKAEIQDIVGPIAGTQKVTTTGVGVRMRGMTSGPTAGTIISIDLDGDNFEADTNQTPPQFLFARHYTGAFAMGKGFAKPGDSGSAVLSEGANNIMGVVFGGSDTMALATPIDPILTAFGIAVETATTTNDVRTVPANPAMARAKLDTQPAFAKALTDRLQQMHREIAATAAGAELAEAVRRHADEALRLVHTNRRVATVWHRNGGPQIVQSAIGALHTPDRPLPREIEGRPVPACLRKIQAIFQRYASAAFATDLSRLGPRIIGLCGLSYNQTLAALEEMNQE